MKPNAKDYEDAKEQLNTAPKNASEHKQQRELERAITGVRVARLEQEPIAGKYDLAHMQKIHKRLFEHLYDHAGKTREPTDTWFKRLDRHHRSDFAHIDDAKKMIAENAEELKQKNYLKGLGKDDFVKEFTAIYAKYNNAHPFEEGNGRTLRTMASQLAKDAGYEFSIKDKGFSQQDWDMASLKSGSHSKIYEGGFVKIPQKPDLEPLTKIMASAISHSKQMEQKKSVTLSGVEVDKDLLPKGFSPDKAITAKAGRVYTGEIVAASDKAAVQVSPIKKVVIHENVDFRKLVGQKASVSIGKEPALVEHKEQSKQAEVQKSTGRDYER